MTRWYKVYRDLAVLLFNFYKENPKSTGRRLYSLIVGHRSKMVLPETWVEKRSIDPVQLFAFISMSKLGAQKRIDRLQTILEVLHPGYNDAGRVNFSGCPFPVPVWITAAREIKQQQQIWQAFAKIMERGQKGLDEKLFEQSKTWFGIDTASFTIFLFWIDSDNFLPLDKNTDRLLIECGIFKVSPRKYADYKKLIRIPNDMMYRSITNIAYAKMDPKKKVGFQRAVNNFFKRKAPTTEGNVDFKLIAIRPLAGLEKTKFLKVLTKETNYVFYKAFSFEEKDKIKYDKTKDPKLFSIQKPEGKLDVNISAIVGKNGSGKSTLTELLYVSINNMVSFLPDRKSEFQRVPGINVDLYFYTDTVYRIRLLDDNIQVTGYLQSAPGEFSIDDDVSLDDEFLQQFFYTVAINYSHYALNSRNIGEWVQHVFHKNDAYQAPIVINPMRTQGNIDINIEKDLVISRLLVNLLGPNKELRKLTENKIAVALKLKLNYGKLDFIERNKGKFPERLMNSRVRALKRYFKVPFKTNMNDAERVAEKYLFKKLVNICMNYPHYSIHLPSLSGRYSKTAFTAYLDQLEEDHSHITNKLKQAINFLKFNHFKKVPMDRLVPIDDLARMITNVQNKPSGTGIANIELIPPAFYSIEIKMTDGSDFEDLSSGEKQRIHTIHSLIYHLINIDSVARHDDLVQYRYVNIFFDEAELYFHPEMQRCFVFYIMQYLSRTHFRKLLGLNICFITHSPFMLSDIPNSNIIFLDINTRTNKALQAPGDITFGGNIHNMLKTDFFLTHGYLGEFAKDTIQSAINFLKPTSKETNKPGMVKLKKRSLPRAFIKHAWDRESIEQLIDLIGEPMIKNSLASLLRLKYMPGKLVEIENQIAELQKAKSDLEKNKKNKA